MSEFFIENETVQIDFPDGQWVRIKSELTQEDQDAITNAMVKLKDNQPDMILGRLILLERMVVEWSFDKPITRGNLSNLRRKYRDEVLQKIDEVNSTAVEWATKNSVGASSESQPSIS
jgi:hypothetical protein